jgi:hypothetical protein
MQERTNMMWRWLMIAAVLTVGGCDNLRRTPDSGGNAPATSNDPDARTFSGTIISLRPTVSTMLISKEEQVGRERFPNQIVVKYDPQTKFLLDGKPATLDQIQQYMSVTIEGHMRQGQLFAETANFSSVLPPNVKRSTAATQPGAQPLGQP